MEGEKGEKNEGKTERGKEGKRERGKEGKRAGDENLENFRVVVKLLKGGHGHDLEEKKKKSACLKRNRGNKNYIEEKI